MALPESRLSIPNDPLIYLRRRPPTGSLANEAEDSMPLELRYDIQSSISIIGSVSLVRYNADEGSAEGIYWVEPTFRRNGIASQSAKTLFDYGQKFWGLNRITLWISADNVPSIRVATGLGFANTGNQEIRCADTVFDCWERPYV